MSAENVTPIHRGNGGPPTRPERPKPRIRRAKRYRFCLNSPADGEPDNARLIEALHGVCYMMEHVSGQEEREQMHASAANELATAAEILSNMLMDRIVSD